ncbi:MAG: hypothetical protein AAF742_09100 [Pseudomonadota bacterium]
MYSHADLSFAVGFCSDFEAAASSVVDALVAFHSGVALADGDRRGRDDVAVAASSLLQHCHDSDYFGGDAAFAAAVPGELRACGVRFDRALRYGCGVPRHPYFETLGQAQTAAGRPAGSHND